MKETDQCPLCQPELKSIWFEQEHGRVIKDAFPISQGHTLVVPIAHIPSFHDLDSKSQAALWNLVADVRRRLIEKLQPDGFNIGLNDGMAAGQTIMHAHIHVIPRWNGDIADPRGGVRWILPDKARYWSD